MSRASTHHTRTMQLSFIVQLDPSAVSGMVRALSLLHRRQCRVLEAAFHARAGTNDQLELRLEAPQAHAHCLEAWLSALVDVREVRRREPE